MMGQMDNTELAEIILWCCQFSDFVARSGEFLRFPERLRGVFTTRCYTNPCLLLPFTLRQNLSLAPGDKSSDFSNFGW